MLPRRAAAALLAAGTLALAGCGSGDGSASGSGTRVSGTGYAFSVPEGWQDTKSVAAAGVDESEASLLDRAYGAPTARAAFRQNVATTRGEIPGSVGAEEAVRRTAENARAAFSQAGSVSPSRPTTLDGEPATTYVISREVQGVDVRQRQVVAADDGFVFTLTVSYAASESGAGQEVVDRAERTWSWR